MQERGALGCGGAGGVGVGEGVEHHEVVDDALEADRGDRHAGVAELVRVRLALVAQDVGLAGDDQRRRQAGELLRRWRGAATR